MVSFRSRPLYLQKLGGRNSRSEGSGEEKHFLLMLGVEILCLDTVTKHPPPKKKCINI